MTKQEILDNFNDINFVYNDSSRHETLSRMLDELLKEQESVVRCKDCVYFEPDNAEEGDSYGRCRNNYAPCQNQQVEMMWFCADGERQEGR